MASRAVHKLSVTGNMEESCRRELKIADSCSYIRLLSSTLLLHCVNNICAWGADCHQYRAIPKMIQSNSGELTVAKRIAPV